mgnify:CR=1 FL=1
MYKVGIDRCNDYDYDKVEESVFKCIDSIEGLKNKIPSGSKALVKVNLLKRNHPEDAVTTHPAVVEAVVKYLQRLHCKVTIGDSPGGPFNEGILKSIYKVTGMENVAKKTSCELNFDTTYKEIHYEKAKMLKNMKIISVAENADFIVSTAKLKTHAMMTYTGAVKNLFGIIPGLIKADYHFKMNNINNFAAHLVDICEYANPLFSIIDGIEGMEGDGPSAGDIRKSGIILASDNPHALDLAASKIIGIEMQNIPTIREAIKRGILSGDGKDILYACLKPEDIIISPFKLPKSTNVNFVGGKIPSSIENYLLNKMRPKPVFDYSNCISCGICKDSCPSKIIDMTKGKPEVDLDKCIRCFCCHELCPKKAVIIKKHWLYDRAFR